jgi:hypothetical protein
MSFYFGSRKTEIISSLSLAAWESLKVGGAEQVHLRLFILNTFPPL